MTQKNKPDAVELCEIKRCSEREAHVIRATIVCCQHFEKIKEYLKEEKMKCSNYAFETKRCCCQTHINKVLAKFGVERK